MTDDAIAAWPLARGVRQPRLRMRRQARRRDLELGFRSLAVQVGVLLGWVSIVVVLGRARARRRRAASLAAGRLDARRRGRQHRRDDHSLARLARGSPRPAPARPLVRRVDRVRRAARRQRRLELLPAAVSRGARSSPSCRSAGAAASGSPCSAATCTVRRCADSALGRRDGDATRPRRGRRLRVALCSRGRSAARQPRTSAPRRAPSSSGRSRRKRTTASRTTCRRPPISSSSAVRTASDGAAFDETAARIRSIATVHRLLTETEDRVDGGALLRGITDGVPVPVTVEAEPADFDAATAQKLGIVANELVTNAFQHGVPPIVVRLERGTQTRLSRRRPRRRDRRRRRLRPRARAADGRAGSRWTVRAARAERRRHSRRGRLSDRSRDEGARRRGRPADRARPVRASALARPRADRACRATAPRRSSSRERAFPTSTCSTSRCRRSTVCRPRRSSQTRACAGRSSSSPASKTRA